MKLWAFPMTCLTGGLLAVLVSLGAGSPAVAKDDQTDPTLSVVLTDITVIEGKGAQASLSNRSTRTRPLLRLVRGGNMFQIKTAAGRVAVSGQVVAIFLAKKEVIFRAGDAYYAVRLGETVAEALRKPLGPDRVKEFREEEIQNLQAE